ncbi:MAG: NAD(P)-dependent oxidoreductase [Bacteroidales bacterium]|nr:NAD(P)-dependent oxidoreductase [Bacteroidales bacterium]
MKKRVLVTYNMFREGYSKLIEKYDVTFPPADRECFSYDEVMEVIDQYDALQSMYNFPVDKNLLDKATKLKIVSNYAVGYDNIDIPYATQKGVVVTNTPDPVTEPTADMAMGLLLSVARRISECDRNLRIPGKIEWGLLDNLGYSLYGKQLGIFGMGRIGKALARRAIASGMKIVYHNHKPISEEQEKLLNARYVSFEELITTSDVVSINAPHTNETHHIINEKVLEKMKKTAILINTARGPLVDEAALAKALKNKTIYGAGLDVFEFGHKVSDELLELDNVVLTPHIGTQTFDVRNEMAYCVSENIINFFEGGKITRVN